MVKFTVADVRRTFSYDHDTGLLVWLARPVSDFSSPARCADWNRKYKGQVAGSMGIDGYWALTWNCSVVRAHRLIWMHVFGVWPELQVDHVNGDRSDNRIANLRLVDSLRNSQNMRLNRRNTSGASGVDWRPKSNKWIASIRVARRYIYLGSFIRKDDAIAARKSAEAQYGFHPNHGRQAA